MQWIIWKRILFLKEAYPQVDIDSETDTIGGGLATAFALINEAVGAKFIIIIDEWDAFFRNEKSNKEVQTRYVNLLRSLFKGNRSKKFTALAYITGILPVKK